MASARRTMILVLACRLQLEMPAEAAVSRRQCRAQCVDRVATCVAAGSVRRACRRDAVRMCRRDGLAACPALDRAQFTADVVASMAEELMFHAGLCVATLPAIPVSSLADTVAVGRDVAAGLIGISADTLDARNVCRQRVSCRAVAMKYFIQGTLGAGGPLVPFARLVSEVAGGEVIVYSDASGRTAFAILGPKDGLAFGIVVTGFAKTCAP